jgi:hypothetical protein
MPAAGMKTDARQGTFLLGFEKSGGYKITAL